jgi:hypothetical protein
LTWDRTWVMGYRRWEVNLCFLLYQSTCKLLQGFQDVIFWSLWQRFTAVLFGQVTSCVHEFFFCKTSEGCVQRANKYSVLQDQSEVWSRFTTLSAVSNLFLYNNFYMFNANKCLGISLYSCLSDIFMSTPDGIMIWNETISNKCLLILPCSWPFHQILEASILCEKAAVLRDMTEGTYCMYYFMQYFVEYLLWRFILFVHSHIFFYLTFCVSWTRTVRSLFVGALHCLMAETGDTGKKLTFRIHRLITWLWNCMPLECMLIIRLHFFPGIAKMTVCSREDCVMFALMEDYSTS